MTSLENLETDNHARSTEFNVDRLKWLAIIVATVISLAIALLSRAQIHPDETVHIGGFDYFVGRLFPPDIGSDDVVYSSYGQSRVFSREIVYIFYGNLAYLLQKLSGVVPSYITYRLFNVGLLFVTLTTLFFTKTKSNLIPFFGFVFVSIPQICYIYSYANSDAWALSFNIFVFIFAVYLWDKAIGAWSIRDLLILGSLTGLVLVSKANFFIGLLLPYTLIAYRLIEYFLIQKKRSLPQWLPKLAAWCLTILVIAAPLQIVYTLSQGDYQAALYRTREERAIEGFKPSNPTSRGLHLKQKGYSYDYLFQRKWHVTTARSFWALFGGMSIRARPSWLYRYVFYGAVMLVGLTAFTLVRSRLMGRDLFLTLCMPAALLTIVLNIYASLRYSLDFDYQPQGRYLFSSFISFCFFWVGTIHLDAKSIKIARGLLLTCLYSFALYTLLFVGIPRLLLK